MISRVEVLRRARSLWAAGTVPYSQGTIHRATGYRQDCSGYVSMCWGIPPNASPGGWGGLNTVTLLTGGWMREIPASELMPGDAVGICGPDTGGDAGHIVLFAQWASDAEEESRYWLYEQAGGRHGPVHRLVTYPYGGPTGAWRAYRFRDIVDTNEGAEMQLDQVLDATGRTVRTALQETHAATHSLLNDAEDGLSARLARLAKDVAEIKARPAAVPFTLTTEQLTEVARQVAVQVGDTIHARMKE